MSALADYYAAQAAENYARVPLLRAQADQTTVNTGQIAQDAASKRALEGAQAGNLTANANATTLKLPGEIAQDAAKTNAIQASAGLTAQQASVLGLKLPSEIAASNAAAGFDLQRTASLASTTPSDLATAEVQRQATSRQNPLISPEQFAAYLAQFKGKEKGGIAGRKKDDAKPGKTDMIPTMLAPGEAVINKHAVDHYGAGVIDHMNAMGLLRSKAHDEVHKAHKKHNGKAA